MSLQPPVPRKRPRHLMDPSVLAAGPRRAQDAVVAKQRLTRVQQWVMSVLAVTTILHLSAGMVVASVFLPEERGVGSQIGLDAIAAAFGVIAVATGRAIHRRPVLSPWLVLGVLPGLVGLWLTL